MEKIKIVLTCPEKTFTGEFLDYLNKKYDLVPAGCSIGEDETIGLLQKADVMIMGGNEIITPRVNDNISQEIRFIFAGQQASTSFPGTWEKCAGRVSVTGGGQDAVIRNTLRQLETTNIRRLKNIPRSGIKTETSQQTLLVVGAGHIGSRVMKEAASRFKKVIYAGGRSEKKELRNLGFEYVDRLGKAFSQADAVSIHLELNDQTKGSIRFKDLIKMPDYGFLLNNARSAIIPAHDLALFLSERPDVSVIFDEFYVNGAQLKEAMRSRRAGDKMNILYKNIMEFDNFKYTRHSANQGPLTTQEYGAGARGILEKLGY